MLRKSRLIYSGEVVSSVSEVTFFCDIGWTVFVCAVIALGKAANDPNERTLAEAGSQRHRRCLPPTVSCLSPLCLPSCRRRYLLLQFFSCLSL